ncbi:NADH-FMN oxidoreductase RutF, flavin reductase (DIM6/NTAB) family [Micromonospora pallida]|uniref:NADH-FMN oxidoreductase RutF, flavin reductase (DIM6/NTAB) family n=1 Tax=Micromonospora pallida TaxID=145854 RepID=A0A1C6SFC0_9ACTN|nr:flavin reductase family protein [Micromonospora pallida]SCL28164.1 NADH-FMN oxidoreductase RutF, flavin reductase (DIM6/NTAB) family [Micromonospora pallida]
MTDSRSAVPRHVSQFKRTGPEWIREATKLYPAGVAAICAMVDGQPVGFVATSFTVGISFEPPLVLFAVQNSSRTWPLLRDRQHLGVSALAADQMPAVYQLASRSRDRFAGLSIAQTDTGALFIDGAALWLECHVETSTPAGDHEVVILHVEGAASGEPRTPLIQHGPRLWTLAEPLQR